MKSKVLWLAGCAVVWTLSVTAALAEGKTERIASADKAVDCATEGKGLKGEEKQKAVNDCMKGLGTSRSTGHSQQDKMKYCNVEARNKELHGDERRAFMSSCLKG